MKRKPVSLFLALVACLGLLPTTVLAAGTRTLEVGKTLTLRAHGSYNAFTERYGWEIEDERIVSGRIEGSHDATLVLTGLRAGTTTVTLHYQELKWEANAPADWFGTYGENVIYDRTDTWTITVTGADTSTPAAPTGPTTPTTPTTPTRPAPPTTPEPVDPDFTIDRNGVLTIYNGKYNGKRGAVAIPSTVKKIGQAAFLECTEVTSVTIPSSVASIGKQAFEYCTSLTSVTIPSSVTSIDNWAFNKCTALKDIYYGGTQAQWKSISIGSSNESLKTATIHYESSTSTSTSTTPTKPTAPTTSATPTTTANSDFTIENGVLTKYNGKGGAVTIPNNVTSIGESAFQLCENLVSVSIPNSVNSIEMTAFQGCTGLTSVTIPDSVNSIGRNAFQYCRSLTNVMIPDSVTSIGEWAFYNCFDLKDVYYGGTQAQWNAIAIGEKNDPLTTATLHYSGGSSFKPNTPALPEVELIPASGTAYAADQTIRVNGIPVKFQAYALEKRQRRRYRLCQAA